MKIIWQQIGDLEGRKILDFGSGEGITASNFAKNNAVTAIEPSEDMLSTTWKAYDYVRIVGSIDKLKYEDKKAASKKYFGNSGQKLRPRIFRVSGQTVDKIPDIIGDFRV